MFSGSVSVADAVEAFRDLRSLTMGVKVARCGPTELRELTEGIRDGQEALDVLLIEVGIVAAEQEAHGRGRGPQATMMGDGSRVRGAKARREADRSKTAAKMDKVGDAVKEGRIGAAQVNAIAQAAKGLTDEEQQSLNIEEIIDAAESLSADSFARRVRQEVDRIKGDHGLADTKEKQRRSSWKHWMDRRTETGRIAAEFDPERYEAIVNAIEAQVTRLANEGGVKKSPNLAAEAAFQLLTGKAQGSLGLPHINVVVDHQTLRCGAHDESVRETAAGSPLPPESIARLACDAVLQRVALDQNRIPIDVGRKRRTATDAQWQALRATYRSCAWKDCERPLAWCQAHHIHEWEHGGPTDLCNLIPLCNQHHHAVHEGGWQVKLCGDTRKLDIYDPDRLFFGSEMPDRLSRADKAGRRVPP